LQHEKIWAASLRRSRSRWPRSFVAFLIAGGIGFVVDAIVLAILFRWLGADVYAARLVSFSAAVTTTWWFNRRWTFAPSRSRRTSREYVRYFGISGIGFLINFSVYALCIQASPIMASHPELALAVGSVAGLLFNYFGSRSFVFS
jgi:putative flippase GtrA